MGKWFYDGIRTKAAEFCGLGGMGGIISFLNMEVLKACGYFGLRWKVGILVRKPGFQEVLREALPDHHPGKVPHGNSEDFPAFLFNSTDPQKKRAQVTSVIVASHSSS